MQHDNYDPEKDVTLQQKNFIEAVRTMQNAVPKIYDLAIIPHVYNNKEKQGVHNTNLALSFISILVQAEEAGFNIGKEVIRIHELMRTGQWKKNLSESKESK